MLQQTYKYKQSIETLTLHTLYTLARALAARPRRAFRFRPNTHSTPEQHNQHYTYYLYGATAHTTYVAHIPRRVAQCTATARLKQWGRARVYALCVRAYMGLNLGGRWWKGGTRLRR